ncbi:DNA gyrase/topoisomerase IV subunit A [Rariglobus hedericola]|uniref:DNA gyrase/topoisomerase IV subunit A n=1 Tax=Rariglobus hedericola TaxID=2597822 RepID=A0A556QS26_9BACT|nr:DNA gyrase/topoisomerase IV subunit A [Rariglobus hedericola]TSJ79446.1 DNA gyrase/topoisomerase IV subunit A [Rariglobus hedericola]
MPNRKDPKDEQPELPLAGKPAPESAAPPVEAVELVAAEAEVPKNNDNAPLAHSYQKWFLEYASYVILDRAVPHIDDGLKPVQRRILHTFWEQDDGRFHKVANIVGAAMRFHPHGDASIGAALVGMGQRGYLVEPQGNFGNLLTGDDAAAPRYIEARLTAFAREVLFNPKTTVWQSSYDGRAKEPVTLPAKFPIVLLDGAEGIAVGLSTKILPHNFNDICRCAINHLQGKRFKLVPDFPSGGIADFADYNDGERGAKVKVRAKMESRGKHQIAITELPYGVTTTSLIESILAANAKGKIKVKHVDDNTSESVEIIVHLPQGADADQVMNQLYVFTDCQVSISPAACVIDTIDGQDKPVFLGVSEILRRSVDKTVQLLKQELDIKLGELEQQWHWDSLERIFIEERVYRRIETSKTWESVLAEIHEGLKPFVKKLRRAVTDEDVTRLTEIRIKRISAYNRFKADEAIKAIEDDIKQTKHHLAHLTEFAIKWFETLQEKYGKGRKRRTTCDEVEQISAAQVVVANQKLYVNREEGFVGLNWRQHEFVVECTILDDVVAFMGDATCKVVKVADKVFVGKDIRHLHILPKDGDDRFYTVIYQDKESGKAFAKRFQLGGTTREKVYNLAASEGSKLVFFDETKNQDSIPTKVRIQLSGRCSARVKDFEFDLKDLAIGSRGAKGLTVTQYPVKEVTRA